MWHLVGYYKETPTQVFSFEICNIIKNPYFEEHVQTTASIHSFNSHHNFHYHHFYYHQNQPFTDVLQNRCS